MLFHLLYGGLGDRIGFLRVFRYTSTRILAAAITALVLSFIIGPWFMATSNSGVFVNFPTKQNSLLGFPRNPTAPAAKTTTGLGAVGMWVNGVATRRDGVDVEGARPGVLIRGGSA